MITAAFDYGREQGLPPTRRHVLLTIADAADDSGRCWPSQRRIHELTGLSVSTIRTALREFEELGILTTTARVRSEGRGRTSNLYHLGLLEALSRTDEQPPAPGDRSDGPTANSRRPTANSHATNRRQPAGIEPSEEPSRTVTPLKGPQDEFEEWLLHYRETTGRPALGSAAAREAFTARRREGATLDQLKLATVGCHADKWRRDRGHDVPETILRRSNWHGYYLAGVEVEKRSAAAQKRAPLVSSREAA